MRWGAFVLAVLAGCELYFGPSQDQPSPHSDARPDAARADARPRPDAFPPDANPSSFTFETCEGGKLYRSAPQPDDTAPADLVSTADLTGQCDCLTDGGVYECLGDATCAGAAPWLCTGVAGCPTRDSACGPSGSQNETWGCSPGTCSDGLCSPLAVLGAVAGHWQGWVTPPSFATPYHVDLVIAPDGHISPHRDDLMYGTAFYYGDDGPNPDRWFRIASISPSGAIGTVGVMFDYDEIIPGLVTHLRVDATHLSFRFWDSWLDCTRPFDFALTRVP